MDTAQLIFLLFFLAPVAVCLWVFAIGLIRSLVRGFYY